MSYEKQNIRLQPLTKSQYEHLISLYRQVKEEGIESKVFNQLYKALYVKEPVISFDEKNPAPLSEVLYAHHRFEAFSLPELSLHLAAVVQADRFAEGTIVSAYNNGLFEKIFESMEQKVRLLQN